MEYILFICIFLCILPFIFAVQVFLLRRLSIWMSLEVGSFRRQIQFVATLTIVSILFNALSKGLVVLGIPAKILLILPLVSIYAFFYLIRTYFRTTVVQTIRPAIFLIFVPWIMLLITRGFIASPLKIPTASMTPALFPNDCIIASNYSYVFSDPEYGDVAVFSRTSTDDLYLARIIGVPNDEIEQIGTQFWVNGVQIEDPWGHYSDEPSNQMAIRRFGPIIVPPDHYFMLGDNRDRSMDSRTFGTIPREAISAKAMVRYLPPSRLAIGPF